MPNNPIQDFFDQRAPLWDSWADDDLGYVRSLLDRIGIHRGDRVLDLACGTGVITGLLHEYSEAPVVAMDLSPKMVEAARAKYASAGFATFLAQDFYQYDGEPFDVIVIYNAYPHFVDVPALIQKLRDCLKTGGRAAIVHSLGRERLARHHENVGSDISRDLLPVEEESKPFAPFFEVYEAEEDDDHYLLCFRKAD